MEVQTPLHDAASVGDVTTIRTMAAEGFVRWTDFIHHRKSGKAKDGMDDFLTEHRTRHTKMHDLLFEPIPCPHCTGLVPHDHPDQVKGLILTDAANLDEAQEELLLSTTGTGEEPPTHDVVEAKL